MHYLYSIADGIGNCQRGEGGLEAVRERVHPHIWICAVDGRGVRLSTYRGDL
jgi:hypothetical protein